MKKQRKSSRKAMADRRRARKTTASYIPQLDNKGEVVAQPMNRKAYKIELSKLEHANGLTVSQHKKEVRKQRLTKARRKLRTIQDESRKANRV